MHHLVVIGASAGGIEALREIVRGLPRDFPAPICVVIHSAPQSPGLLPDILSRAGVLPAVTARDKQRLDPGRIYVPPPDYHLIVEPDRLRISNGPTENRFRPAIDPLFRSAAQVYGPAAIGVILTGSLDDGTAGLWAIRRLGGVAVVQDPSDAQFSSMPQSALANVGADHCVLLPQIASLLVALTTAPARVKEGGPVPDHIDVEVKIAKGQHPLDAGLEQIADPSPYACPECHGVLLQLTQEGNVRFRCHTGHAYSIESLLAAIAQGIKEALWNSIRSLEEGGLLLRNMAEDLDEAVHSGDIARITQAAQEMRQHSDTIRSVASQLSPAKISDE